MNDEERFLNAQAYIKELQRRINSQHRYIAELEKQLEYQQPGIVKEVQEFIYDDTERHG